MTQYNLTNAFPKLRNVVQLEISSDISIDSFTNAFPLLEEVEDRLSVTIHSTTPGYTTMLPQLSFVGTNNMSFSYFDFISHASNVVVPSFLDNLYNFGNLDFIIRNAFGTGSANVVYPSFQSLINFSHLNVIAYGEEMLPTWSGAFPSLQTCGILSIDMITLENLNNFAPLLETIDTLSLQGTQNLQNLTNSFSSLTTANTGIYLQNLKITNLDNFVNLQTCANISIASNEMLTNIFTGLVNVTGSSVQSMLIAGNVQLSTSQTDLLLNNYLSEGFSGSYEIFGNSD
jgi:hypothetical protein